MPNIASLLKQEITRLSRREIRNEVASIKKASATYRRDIAALKRHVAELQRKSTSLTKSVARSGVTAPALPERPVRFVAKGLVSLRKRLGLSAAGLGSILGVSEQAVYNWETKKAVPRKDTFAAIIALRGVGKREAQQRLQQVKAHKPAAKKKK